MRSWMVHALSSFESYPLCKCSPVNPFGPVPLSKWPQEECEDYDACGQGGGFAFHECQGTDQVKNKPGICTYDYVFNNNLSGMFADKKRFPKYDLQNKLGNKELSVKFPGQPDSQATQVRVVDTTDDVVSPYIDGKDGKPLPFQMDLEYWTAMKLIPWDITSHGSITKGEFIANKAKNPLFDKYAHPSDGGYVMANPAADVGGHHTICIKRPS